METGTILDVVLNTSGATGFDTNAGDFDILREAVLATDLAGALSDADADFSVFAPTDAAFIQLARDLGVDVADGHEAGALNDILAQASALAGGEAEGLVLVKDILLTHVLPGEKSLAELDAAGVLTTLNSAGATVEVDGSTILDAEPDLPDATVAIPDIKASNGKVQAIDRVILPLDVPSNETIVTVAANDDRFEILVQAVIAAGLADTLSAASDLTVFAPTDAAFASLAHDFGYTGDPNNEDAVFAFLVEALTELGDGDPIPVLTNILLYQVSPGTKTATEIDALNLVPNLLEVDLGSEGTELTDAATTFANPNIVAADVPAGDNLIQAIDRVLLPIDLPGPVAVQGGNGRDVLDGNGGNETIFGNGGRDEISGGGGEERLNGGKGRDTLEGDGSDDVLIGGKGRDHLDGGAGDDKLRGGKGSDTLGRRRWRRRTER